MSKTLVQKLADMANVIEQRLEPVKKKVLFLFCPSWLSPEEVLAEHLRAHRDDEAAFTVVAPFFSHGQNSSHEVVRRQNIALGRSSAARLRVQHQLSEGLKDLPNKSPITGVRCLAYGIGELSELEGVNRSEAVELLTVAGIDMSDPFIHDGFDDGVKSAKGLKHRDSAEGIVA